MNHDSVRTWDDRTPVEKASETIGWDEIEAVADLMEYVGPDQPLTVAELRVLAAVMKGGKTAIEALNVLVPLLQSARQA
jgi:hypothetical protein